MVLKWLFRDMKFNPSTSQFKTKNLCIEYYLIKKAGCEYIDLSTNNRHDLPEAATIQHTLPSQLIVFIYKVSTIIYDDLPGLCREYIIPILLKKKLPFILCWDYVDTAFAESSVKNAVQMKTLEILRTSLLKLYKVAITNVPSGM